MISIATILGDSIGYELGRHPGRGWMLKHGARFGLGQEQRHAGKAVFGSHFLHLLRALMSASKVIVAINARMLRLKK